MNFGKLLESTYRRCGFVRLMQAATGGSATTIVDTALANLFGDDEFKNDIAFISTTTDGASPQNKFGVISAFASDTQTLTIPTVTDAVQSGDVYCVVKHQLGLYEAIAAVNAGLQSLPATRIPDTSLSVAASTLKYTLPAATKNYPIQNVYIGNDTDGWELHTDFRVNPAAAGSQESIEFFSQPKYQALNGANYSIKIYYLGKHSDLSLYSAPISEYYADELVKAACAFKAFEYFMEKTHKMEDAGFMTQLGRLEQSYARAVNQNPVRIPPADIPRTVSLGRL